MPRKPVSEKEVVLSTPATPRRKPASTRAKRTVPAPAPAASVAAIVPATTVPEIIVPTFEQIAKLAYSYWEARGYRGGSQEEDWLRAEQELSARSDRAAAAIA